MEGFRKLIDSDKSSSSFFEDQDGEHRKWPGLSSEGKLWFITGAAAMYDIPFERFAATVHAELGDAASVTQAALHVALDYRKELHGLGKLLPDDGRTESTPLVERFQEILDYKAPEYAGLMAHDTAESVKTRLESFQDEFERLARTREQKELVAAFKDFVGEVTHAGMKETFDKLLARYAEGERQTPETGLLANNPGHTASPADRLQQMFDQPGAPALPPDKQPTAEEWQYRIEPYRRIPGEAGWAAAKETEADVWFGFRDCGDDHRCFGVFPTRGDAERAMELLKGQGRQLSRGLAM
jgi:hypothetical protein